MHEFMPNAVKEMKCFLKWLSVDYSTWESTWDGTFNSSNTLDQIEEIEEMQKHGRYPQILTLAFDYNNELQTDAIQSIIEEIAETWGKEQWDEVIQKLIYKLKEKP